MYERTHKLDGVGKVVARPAVSDLPARLEKGGMSIRLSACLTSLTAQQAGWLRSALLPIRLIGSAPQLDQATGQFAWCYLASLDATQNTGTMLVIAITDQQGQLRQLHGRRIDPIHLHGGESAQVLINASFAAEQIVQPVSARAELGDFNSSRQLPFCSAGIDRVCSGDFR